MHRPQETKEKEGKVVPTAEAIFKRVLEEKGYDGLYNTKPAEERGEPDYCYCAIKNLFYPNGYLCKFSSSGGCRPGYFQHHTEPDEDIDCRGGKRCRCIGPKKKR